MINLRVVVVGAGASGLVCAIVLARRGFSVTVVDKLKSSGKKLLVTGNGRCNYWNEDFDNKHFYSNNKDFIECINTSQNRESVMEFFKSVGITPTIKNGYYYPMSMQASSIRDTLLLEANRLGVTFLNDFNVTEIKYINDTFFVVGEGECFCDKLIIATGSYSYYNDKTSGYDICKSFGHTIKPVLPSLVQLIGSDNFYKDWAGVRSSSKVSIYVDEKLEKEEKGEIMLTDYGISGTLTVDNSEIITTFDSSADRRTLTVNDFRTTKAQKVILKNGAVYTADSRQADFCRQGNAARRGGHRGFLRQDDCQEHIVRAADSSGAWRECHACGASGGPPG